MRRLGLGMICLVVGLAGCGGTVTPVAQRDNTIRVRLGDFSITPRDVSVHAGQVHLEAVNDGQVTHNLVIEQADRQRGEEATIYGRTPTLHPGQRGKEIAAILLKPGTYRLTCTIANHDDLGQHGTLIVTR